MKKIILIAAFILSAMSSYAQHSEIFATDGKAIKGYDVVAFFKEGKPVQGSDSLVYKYKESDWLFASRANLEAFKAEPEKFVPQYGGYCAYGTSEGHKAPTQAETWTIVDDKLYFNYNMKVKNSWSKNQKDRIDKADVQWPIIKNSKP